MPPFFYCGLNLSLSIYEIFSASEALSVRQYWQRETNEALRQNKHFECTILFLYSSTEVFIQVQHDKQEHSMPVPSEYQRATDDFFRFLVKVRDLAGFGSTHQAYTMVQGVLQTFRRRLEVKDAILFASVLPPVVRAIFVADWDTSNSVLSFEDRASMTKEVRALRAGHNFSTETAIQDVSTALRQCIDKEAFDHVLSKLPAGAQEFWQV